MREILFRGKRMDNGEWVYGTPFFSQNACKMIYAVALHPDFVDEGNVYYSEANAVDSSTIGQFTGLIDKTGKKIFEGDILFDGVQNYEVKYSPSSSGFEAFGKGEDGIWSLYHLAHKGNCGREIEITGNVYDNPELLCEKDVKA